MKWLKRKLRNWVDDAREYPDLHIGKVTSSRDVEIDHSLSTDPLRLSIYRANGGTVVETRVYDRVKDRNQNQLYIVGNDQDLGESLSKIITMEALRG